MVSDCVSDWSQVRLAFRLVVFERKLEALTYMNETINKGKDLPATVGETHGDGAEKQAAFGLADDGLTVSTRGDD